MFPFPVSLKTVRLSAYMLFSAHILAPKNPFIKQFHLCRAKKNSWLIGNYEQSEGWLFSQGKCQNKPVTSKCLCMRRSVKKAKEVMR